MNSVVDLMFVGHMAVDEVHHFGGEVTVNAGSAVLCGALAAVRCGKSVSVVTRMALEDRSLIESMESAGVDVHVIPAPVTTYMKVVHSSEDMDERSIFQFKNAGTFKAEQLPQLNPRIIHLAGISDQEFDLPFIQQMKNTGALLSADMQSFVRQVDSASGAISFEDVPLKEEIISLLDFVKLDVLEAEILTGTRDLEAAARVLGGWGEGEVLITSSNGVLGFAKGSTVYSDFSNRSVVGRTGRGDTTFGAYLARRLDHSMEESLRFAAALVSIKMESNGPFQGSLQDVLDRMEK